MTETAASRVTQDRWSWPINQCVYDRFTGLYPHEVTELVAMTRRNRFGCWSRQTQENLARLRCPVQAALKIIEARDSCWCTCTTVLLLEMHRRQESFWGWNHAAWIETLCTSPADFCNRHALAGDEVRPHLAAVAYLLGCFQDIPALGTISYVTLAREVFGRSRVNDSICTAVDAITAWGYGAGRAYDLRTTLGVLFLANRSPDLRDLTVSFLEEQRRLSNTSRRSGSILTVSKVLMTLGLTGRALSRPPQSDRVKAMVGVSDGVPSQWLESVEKWFSTSTLERKTRRMYRLSLFKVGRWLAAVHPQCLGPGDWTREIAADWVAAVCRMQIGDWAHSNIYVKGRVGKPLAACSRANHLNSVGAFFRDCQEWEWIPRRFDPRRCFSIPRSVRGLIAPNPRHRG